MESLMGIFLAIVVQCNATVISDQENVIAADKQLNFLIQHHDAKGAEQFYASDFILTTSSGKDKVKSEILVEIESQELYLEINDTYAVTVRILENTAILTGILHQKGTYKDNTFDVKLRVTDTWVKTSSGWKILAGHASVIK